MLRKYGLGYLKGNASGFAEWDFVSTRPMDIERLGSAFGLTYYQQNNLIVHSMSTILLSPDGTVKPHLARRRLGNFRGRSGDNEGGFVGKDE